MICNKCNSKHVIKKGRRKTKHTTKQRYYCKDCNQLFVHQRFKHKTYNTEIIRDAITLYNQGYTLDQATRHLRRRYKIRVSTSSVHRWIQEQRPWCTITTLRPQFTKQYGHKILISKQFEYQGLAYNFKYHKGKLELYRTRFPSLSSYIQRCATGCPSFFETIPTRCSQLRLQVQVQTTKLKNHMTRPVMLAIEGVTAKKKRHPLVETFLLVNDDATVGVEVPIWFWDKTLKQGIAGHIDVIQVKQKLVYVLDYKPEASLVKENQVIPQLYLYARGLSFRTHIPLHSIRCGWFDETTYIEFTPSTAVVRYPQVKHD